MNSRLREGAVKIQNGEVAITQVPHSVRMLKVVDSSIATPSLATV
jgi:hypothetical protein